MVNLLTFRITKFYRDLPALIVVMAMLIVSGCSEDAGTCESALGRVYLVFDITLNQRVYQDSAWGDPPQIAIWIQNRDDKGIQTVMVTHRTGACDWEGKVECAVALPYWVGFYDAETGTAGPPSWDHPAPDAVTRATPTARLTARARVSRGSRWNYFIEVNVSGDYNLEFRSLTREGRSDRYGNGQPSLVYHGSIDSIEGAISQPVLLGRTDQYEPVSRIIENMEGITTARELFESISISCRKD